MCMKKVKTKGKAKIFLKIRGRGVLGLPEDTTWFQIQTSIRTNETTDDPDIEVEGTSSRPELLTFPCLNFLTIEKGMKTLSTS